MVTLVPINEENFEAVLALRVAESQSKFVAPTVSSLAECYLYRNNGDVFPFAIQDKDIVVGFLLLDTDDEDHQMTIWRIMIDQAHQGKGYGRQTIEKTIELAQSDSTYEILIADYVKGNEVMGDLLKSIGFKYHSFNKKFNEHVLHYHLNESPPE
ncbi:GNAT family N-acetyltransferase [Marinilactibacillus sp. Marseille-P9653]|uniref:GNAT family N-acetyltransferase n=1 Tax=Marinilactibacillus sp. Marseille-P9653 TaxID=2866583 RepID=UPI001CE3DB49|nr:GNAT family N-acetyltransferase [Marinilactibacillus sp. Marseille-P9653]